MSCWHKVKIISHPMFTDAKKKIAAWEDVMKNQELALVKCDQFCNRISDDPQH
jgi:hypothetical protein